MTSAAGRDPRPDDARLLTPAQELRLTEWAYQPYATVTAPPPSQADVKALLADRVALAARVAAVEARAANAEAALEECAAALSIALTWMPPGAARDATREIVGRALHLLEDAEALAGRGSAGTTAGKDGP